MLELRNLIQLADISTYRSELMGWSIFWIMILHFGFYSIVPLGFVAQYGYAGVEIFMFVSGFGLYFSLDKNPSLLIFYRRRLLRIFPTYYIIGLLTSFLIFHDTVFQYLFRYTTIGFWLKDGLFADWFVPSILLLYLLAPFFKVMGAKINYLAEHTDYELYMILTEKAGQKWYYTINPKVHWINFDINFDELDTMPFLKKLFFYQQKQRRYKKMFTDYLMEVRPDITVSTVRREINFINDIPDGSKKVGEIHFNKSNYRNLHIPFLPAFVNRYLSQLWMGRLQKQVARLDSFVVLTHQDAAHWKALPNLQVIPNFITHIPVEVSHGEHQRVIAVGRYDRVNGFDLLIEAWKQVCQYHLEWHLDIYGAGNREEYQQMADEMGMKDVVHCHGPVTDIDTQYVSSSLFVLSSRNEGFGLVLVEAMAAGLPVVSFNCPCGPSDIISDGQDGILVENGNIEKLAEAICWMIDHPQERELYGQRARRNAMRFSEEKVMTMWRNLFQTLVTS